MPLGYGTGPIAKTPDYSSYGAYQASMGFPQAPTPTPAPAPASSSYPTAPIPAQTAPTPYAGGLQPNDPKNKFNTQTGQPNPNWVGATPAPAPSPIPPALPPRDLYPITPPDQAAADYERSAIKAAQDRIDSIGARYDSQLKSELATSAAANAPAALEASQRTNALSALMGLSGSSAADSRAQASSQASAKIQTTQNAAITDKVQLQKMTQLNAIYDRIDANAQAIYRSQLDTNATNRNLNIEAEKANKLAVAKNAEESIAAMASILAPQGKTFDDFKNADGGATLQLLMQQTGKSEYQLRAIWDQSVPEDLRPTKHTTYIDDGKGGTIMQQVSFNPITRKTDVQKYAIPVPVSTFNGEEKPIEVGGKLLVRQADGSYVDVAPHTPEELAAQQADINYKNAQAAKLRSEMGGDAMLSMSDAKDMGVPYGTTKLQAQAMGKIPGKPTGATPYQAERALRTLQSVTALRQKVTNNPSIFGRSAALPIPDWLRSDDYRNFNSELETLKSSITFGELTAMREASKTGGALGQVSDVENRLLSSSLGALSMSQSAENFQAQLTKVQESIDRWQRAVNLFGSESGQSDQVSQEEQSVPEGTDGADYGYPGYVSDGTQWVLK